MKQTKPAKIAFVTSIPTDAVPFISATESINERLGKIVETCFRTSGDFRDFGSLDEFIEFARKAHIVIAHLMGDLPDFDILVSTLKTAGVPFYASTSFFGPNLKYRDVSTVEQENYKEIYRYLNYGGKKNF